MSAKLINTKDLKFQNVGDSLGNDPITFIEIRPNPVRRSYNFHVVGQRDKVHLQGPFFLVNSEILLRSDPKNRGKIWVARGEPATSRNGWLLEPGDQLKLELTNLNELFCFIESGWDKLFVWS